MTRRCVGQAVLLLALPLAPAILPQPKGRSFAMHRAEIDQERNLLFLHWIDSLNLTERRRSRRCCRNCSPASTASATSRTCGRHRSTPRSTSRSCRRFCTKRACGGSCASSAKAGRRISHRCRWTGRQPRPAMRRSTWRPRRRRWPRCAERGTRQRHPVVKAARIAARLSSRSRSAIPSIPCAVMCSTGVRPRRGAV
jgi:hypothetical protein